MNISSQWIQLIHRVLNDIIGNITFGEKNNKKNTATTYKMFLLSAKFSNHEFGQYRSAHWTTCVTTACIRIWWRCANVSKWEGYRPTNMCVLTPPPPTSIRQITWNYFNHLTEGQRHFVQRNERGEKLRTRDGNCKSWKDLTTAWHGAKVIQHSKYRMQMTGMGETRMTVMGGVGGRCCEKICLKNRISSYYTDTLLHTNRFQKRWCLICPPSLNIALRVDIITNLNGIIDPFNLKFRKSQMFYLVELIT